MNYFESKKSLIFNIVAAVLMIAVFVLHLTPFWAVEYDVKVEKEVMVEVEKIVTVAWEDATEEERATYLASVEEAADEAETDADVEEPADHPETIDVERPVKEKDTKTEYVHKNDVISIAKAIWLPKNDNVKPAVNYLKANVDGFTMEGFSFVMYPVLLEVLCILGVLAIILRPKNMLGSLCPIAFGVLGIVGYCINPALRVGSNAMIQLILAAAVLIVALVGLIMGIVHYFRNRVIEIY